MGYATLYYDPPAPSYWECPHCGERQLPDFTALSKRKYRSGKTETIYNVTCQRCDSDFTEAKHELEDQLNYTPRTHRLRIVG